MSDVLGQVVSGDFNEIVARQKSGAVLEVGSLAVAENARQRILLQVYNLAYGSQLAEQTRELVAGLKLEDDNDLRIMDGQLRNYTLAYLKPLVSLGADGAAISKSLPAFFSTLRRVLPSDLSFLTTPPNPLRLGLLRSGSTTLAHDVFLDGAQAFTHHILIPAQTGKGKSNLASCLLWDATGKDYCGLLVLDPHDEYYGRARPGLKEHPSGRVVYYTLHDVPPGARTLKIHLRSLRPGHFRGVAFWSDAQWEALYALYRQHGSRWVEQCLLMEDTPQHFHEGTLAVVKRRLMALLGLEVANGEIHCHGIFDVHAGQATIGDICEALERSSTVIIDTSSFEGAVELLVGSLVASEIFRRYKQHKLSGRLQDLPVISILLEEAPRVIGREALERGPNIFSTIAREGRKFKVGLTAITQLPSLIPRDILANMNTKIILGIEMAPERKAIIDSSAQDLSRDERAIAALDRGEAIVTSHFSKFAIPVKIPLFDELVAAAKKEAPARAYPGLQP